MIEIYELGKYEVSEEELRRFYGAKALLTARGLYVIDYIRDRRKIIVPKCAFPEFAEYIRKTQAPDLTQRFIHEVLSAITKYLQKLEKEDTTAVYETQGVFVLTKDKKWGYKSISEFDEILATLHAWPLQDVQKATSAILRAMEEIELMIRKEEITV